MWVGQGALAGYQRQIPVHADSETGSLVVQIDRQPPVSARKRIASGSWYGYKGRRAAR